MIVDNTYFRGEIYIPHAKPSVTDAVTEVEGDVLSFIQEYERECLLKCLGRVLFNQLAAESSYQNIFSGRPGGVLDKWEQLIHGTEYTDPQGNPAVWRGLRFTETGEGSDWKSLLAYYIYFYYERYDFVTRSDVGHQVENSKNSFNVSPTLKVVTAWNKFVDMVQGGVHIPQIWNKTGLLGVDYYSGSKNIDVSLYKFIEDQNELVEDTYPEFTPTYFSKMNRFGL